MHAAGLSWGGDIPTAELEDVVVSYVVEFGRPARGPTYDCGGTPADPDEIIDVEIVSIDGTPWDRWDHGYGGSKEREMVKEQIIDRFVDWCSDEMLEKAYEE